MGPTGQCNTDLCMAKHSYVCEYKPPGELCVSWWVSCSLPCAGEKRSCLGGITQRITPEQVGLAITTLFQLFPAVSC